ncbi:MAG: hypothetical protein HQ522_23575, partial [Bacteroidetes bacterium]|nr:hypothetical protein [Bacteroidota bacterium]
MRKRNFIPRIVIILLFVTSVSFASEKPAKGSATELPDNVKSIIDNKCFGCHNTD